jgi:acylphosphatase
MGPAENSAPSFQAENQPFSRQTGGPFYRPRLDYGTVPGTTQGMERKRLRFSGRVQGVGFRATARSVADRFPVTGWVRNERDGTVTLEVQGTPAQVEAFLIALRGEMGHLISGEDAAAVRLAEEENSFEIRR